MFPIPSVLVAYLYQLFSNNFNNKIKPIQQLYVGVILTFCIAFYLLQNYHCVICESGDTNHTLTLDIVIGRMLLVFMTHGTTNKKKKQ